MDYDEIIELRSSSPELGPPTLPMPGPSRTWKTQVKGRAPTASRKVITRPARSKRVHTPVEDVIEIPDSDDDNDVTMCAAPTHQKENPRAEALAGAVEAGPSQVRNARAGGPGSQEQDGFWMMNPFSANTDEVVERISKNGEDADPFVLGPLGELPPQLAPTPVLEQAAAHPVIQGLPGELVHAELAAAPPEMEVDVPQVPMEEDDPVSVFVAQVLEIVPDLEPVHARGLVDANLVLHGSGVVEQVLHALFENPDYPRVDRKGKRKRVDGDGGDGDGERPPVVRAKVDYGSADREHMGGEHYGQLALDQLAADYPFIPKAHVKLMFHANANHYAPSYLALRQQESAPSPPYRRNATARTAAKGKGREVRDGELDLEIDWLRNHFVEERTKEDAEVAERVNEEQYEEIGDGIECGCCFSTSPFDKMVQCPDAHLFCIDCATQYSSTQLGEHDVRLVCMDQSGCKLAFSESELRRFLSPKLLELYERVKTRKELEAAGIEGLEECPFCEYRVVIENPDEKLFRCERPECGAVSCRGCKKLDHLPKSCKEVDEDRKLGAQHLIEEAMTQALMRSCPQCNKAFIKEAGCNKMTCPNCRTLSCYICRKVITGYEHFNQAQPGQASSSSSSKKCQLWDTNLAQQQNNEVNAAAQRALEEFRRDNPDEDEANLHLDIPEARKVVPDANAPGGARNLLNHPGLAFDPFEDRQHLDREHERIRELMGRQQELIGHLAAARARRRPPAPAAVPPVPGYRPPAPPAGPGARDAPAAHPDIDWLERAGEHIRLWRNNVEVDPLDAALRNWAGLLPPNAPDDHARLLGGAPAAPADLRERLARARREAAARPPPQHADMLYRQLRERAMMPPAPQVFVPPAPVQRRPRAPRRR